MNGTPEDLIARIEQFMDAHAGDMNLLVQARSRAAEAIRVRDQARKKERLREARRLFKQALGLEDEE
jgi:hypothetical protein